jgi:hypothetical protein
MSNSSFASSLGSSLSGVLVNQFASAFGTAVSSGATGLWAWYRERQFVQTYGPVAGPAVALLSGLTLSQATQIVGIIKVLGKLASKLSFRGSSVVAPPVNPNVVLVEGVDKQLPKLTKLWWACLVASLISLVKVRRVQVKGREVVLWRYALTFLGANGVYTLAKLAWVRAKSPIGAVLTTRLISQSLQTSSLSSSQQRQVFVDTPIVRSTPQKNHTHGVSAADRNAGTATAALVANSLGLEPYFVQKSLSDERKGRDGDRSFHWAKDLAVPPTEFHLDSTSQAGVLVDVDYYIDMPQLLARHPGTYFISAFQPTAAGKSVGEYTFRFLANGAVEYRVSGGAEYMHGVWNYSGDTILVEDVGLVMKNVCAYHIDRKYIDEHHCLVMLSLIGRFEMPSALPTPWFLEGRKLERLMPIADNHVVLDVVKPDGIYRSVALLGDHEAVTLPMAQMDAIRAVAVAAKLMVSPATVASNIAPSSAIGLPTERLPPGHAAILTNYLRSVIPHSPPVVYPPTECMMPIYFAKHDYDAPVPLAGFGSPLIGPCYGFAKSIASDDNCIATRVEAFHEVDTLEQVESPVPPTLAGYMVEFAERLIPVPHVGVPVDDDYVREKQARPSQRVKLEQAAVNGPWIKAAWDAFVKIETYVKPTNPRNISQNTPTANLAHSRFMYAFHNGVMATQAWYAFNKTPAECAARVCEILEQAAHSCLADGSRFDGHVKRRARILERICMLRFFARQYHAAVNEALDDQIAIPGKTKEGRRYWSGYGRGSGSLETSDFNSVLTAFIDYCAWRNTTIDGVKCSPDLAWSKLGIYGGDDSLAGAVDPRALKKSAELMGQDYEIEVVSRGERGVNFLNRYFSPEVWHGNVNSMSNPARLLSKLWVGPADLHDVMTRFGERCSGYYRMDRNSPVIGQIVTVAHELLGEFTGGVLAPWDGKFSAESNWPNEDNGWMNDEFQVFIPDFDHQRFQGWIDATRAARDPANLLKAPLCTAHPDSYPPVKQPCVVGEQLMHPAAQPPADALPPKAKEEADEPPGWRSTNGTWKFTESDLFDSSVLAPQSVMSAMTQIETVNQMIPIVGERGKRVTAEDLPTQREARPKKCTHPVYRTRDGEVKDCVCQWTAPKQKFEEDTASYKTRLAKWTKLRNATAKKRGVTIT